MRNAAVVFAALIFVVDDQGYGRARRLALIHARKNMHGVAFPALRNKPARSGPASVKVALNVFNGKLQSRRAAVNDAADCRSVAFAEVGHDKHLSGAR